MPEQIIVQLTTVHNWDDIRIYHKMAKSLAAAGYAVHFVAPAENAVDEHNITFHPLPKIRGRFARIWKRQPAAFFKILKIKPAIVHFHDPELVPLALLLKLFGFKIIYDVHEDVAGQILVKHWIQPWLRNILSTCVRVVERWSAARFDAVVAATPKIGSIFENSRSVTVIRNFPLLREFENQHIPGAVPLDAPLVYVGGISHERGIGDIVDALTLTKHDVRLNLAGRFITEAYEAELRAKPGWAKVNYLGWLDRAGIAKVMSRSRAGLLVVHPTPNHVEGFAIKLFEYFAMSLPAIISDFPLWKTMFDGQVVLVRAADAKAIAAAIDWIYSHPKEAHALGERARQKVFEEWNWEIEQSKLLALYRVILETGHLAIPDKT